MIGAICESPLTIRAIIEWHDSLNEGKMLLRDIIDLDATYGGGPEGEAAEGIPAAAEGEGGAEQPAGAAGTEGAAGEGEEVEPPLGADAEGDGEGDGEENNLSLSAMEAALKPQVLETFEKIAATYERLHRIQESRLSAIQRGEEIGKTDKKYDKIRA